MDSLGRAITNLKKQKQLIENRIRGYQDAITAGAFLRPERTLRRWIRREKAKVEAIDYVLNILESSEGD